MLTSTSGNENVIAGRDVYIERAENTLTRLHTLPEHFSNIDSAFTSILGVKDIRRWDKNEEFSSEKLFASLVTIGIPVSVAITIPSGIIQLLESHKEATGIEIFEANTIKRCVLEVITGLQYLEPFASQEEVTTWSSAYVRRYGSGSEFISVIDGGNLRELNHDFVKELFLPHILENVLGLPRGADVVDSYKRVFSASVIDRMAREIIRIANGLNLYEIEYRTLFRLITEIMIKPPHPWIVNPSTQDTIVEYNIGKAQDHLEEIISKVAKIDPNHAIPSALECAVHSCAAILARYGFLLGVEGKYGLDELIRLCNIKSAHHNLVLWEFCELDLFEERLSHLGLSVKSLCSLLNRLSIALRSSKQTPENLIKTFEYCRQLNDYALKLVVK